jgi:hypothetical protein
MGITKATSTPSAETLLPRHPVLRSGEREPIDPYKRRLIYRRDGYSCRWCGWQVEPTSAAPGLTLQLDHVIPWSAYGSDRSDNLRTLCARCNETHSNFVEPDPPLLIGVVRQCYWCARRTHTLPERYMGVGVDELDHISAYCGRCDGTSWVPDEGWLL